LLEWGYDAEAASGSPSRQYRRCAASGGTCKDGGRGLSDRRGGRDHDIGHRRVVNGPRYKSHALGDAAPARRDSCLPLEGRGAQPRPSRASSKTSMQARYSLPHATAKAMRSLVLDAGRRAGWRTGWSSCRSGHRCDATPIRFKCSRVHSFGPRVEARDTVGKAMNHSIIAITVGDGTASAITFP
jgi:hypothetical protein